MARNKKIAQFTGSKGTVKVYRDVEFNEYIAKMGEASYHTPDKMDAIGTAQQMAGYVQPPPRTVASDVKAGDAISGKLVVRIVQGFLSSPMNRIGFYLENGDRLEFEPHEVVPNHAKQLTLPVITPERRRELDTAIERGEDRKSCECESNECDGGGRHRPGDRCPRPANPKMVTIYGTTLCTKCGEAMPAKYMKEA